MSDNFKRVEAVLAWRDILGIKADQVLRAQFAQNVVESRIEFRARRREKDPAAGARGQRGERVLAARIAAGFVA